MLTGLTRVDLFLATRGKHCAVCSTTEITWRCHYLRSDKGEGALKQADNTVSKGTNEPVSRTVSQITLRNTQARVDIFFSDEMVEY